MDLGWGRQAAEGELGNKPSKHWSFVISASAPASRLLPNSPQGRTVARIRKMQKKTPFLLELLLVTVFITVAEAKQEQLRNKTNRLQSSR